MFRFVESKKKWVQVGLILFSIPFVATGIIGSLDQWLGGGGSDLVHIEGGRSIPELLFDQRWSNYYQQYGKQGSLGVPQRKQLILDSLIHEQVLSLFATRERFLATDQALRTEILKVSAFHDEKGVFSLEKYKALLKQSGQSEGAFEARMRDSIAKKPFDSLSRPWIAEPILDLQLKAYESKRMVRRTVLGLDTYLKGIEVDEAAARAYYTQHQKKYQEPDRVKLEYIEISPEIAQKMVVVTPDALNAYYEKHKKEYLVPETRAVKHILLKVDPNLSAVEKAKKKAKVEDFFKLLKASPEKFAEYAKLYSEDPGSATDGGNLGDVSRGMMVKPFEDAVFSAQPNVLVGPIETEFGYHLIQVTAIKSAGQKTFDELKESLIVSVKQEQARALQETWLRRFETVKDSNLNAVAQELKLELKHSEPMAKELLVSSLDLKPSFVDQLLMQAKANDTKPLPIQELKGQRFILSRPVSFHAAHQPSFDLIKARVIADIQREKAMVQAKKDGEVLLKKLQSNEKPANLVWSTPEAFSFRQPQPGSVPASMKAAVMGVAPKAGQVNYVGGEDDAVGYVIVAVDALIPPVIDATKRSQIKDFMAQIAVDRGQTALGNSLRKLYDVKVNETRWKAILDRKEEPLPGIE